MNKTWLVFYSNLREIIARIYIKNFMLSLGRRAKRHTHDAIMYNTGPKYKKLRFSQKQFVFWKKYKTQKLSFVINFRNKYRELFFFHFVSIIKLKLPV